MEVLLGLDLGTSGVKCLALTSAGEVLSLASTPYPTYTPQPGWVEQHPEDWWHACTEAVHRCLQAITSPVSIQAVGLSGHMSALCLVDAAGQPVHPCITLADTRSTCETEFLNQEHRQRLVSLCGNPPLDALVLPKLLWVQSHRPEALAKTAKILSPKDYLAYRLTGRFVTEPTDAGNSMLFDLAKQTWDEPWIQELGLPLSIFPEVVRSTDIVGTVTPQAAQELGIPPGIPVIAGAADMACSAIGTGAVVPGVVSVTLGTAAQVLTTTSTLSPEGHGRITFHRHAVPDVLYALGSVFTGGLALNWWSSLLSGVQGEGYRPEHVQSLAKLADTVTARSSRVWFLPFLVGRGSPDFSPHARAGFLGLSADTSLADIVHSIMEGVAYNIRECLDVFKEMGCPVESIHVGGGGVKVAAWKKILTDVLGVPVTVMETKDASAVGAAILAGVGIGTFDGIVAAAQSFVQPGERILPSAQDHAWYDRKYRVYKQLVAALAPYADEMALE